LKSPTICAYQDSNPEPTVYQTVALPAAPSIPYFIYFYIQDSVEFYWFSDSHLDSPNKFGSGSFEVDRAGGPSGGSSHSIGLHLPDRAELCCGGLNGAASSAPSGGGLDSDRASGESAGSGNGAGTRRELLIDRAGPAAGSDCGMEPGMDSLKLFESGCGDSQPDREGSEPDRGPDCGGSQPCGGGGMSNSLPESVLRVFSDKRRILYATTKCASP